PELWHRTADTKGALRQSSRWTCAPAAAVMLLRRHGIDASEGEIAYLANTSLFGTDARSLARALSFKLRPRRFHAVAEFPTYEECVRPGTPFVAHVRGETFGGHALFVEKAAQDQVEVIDPVDGIRKKINRAEFERAWDGTVVRVIGPGP